MRNGVVEEIKNRGLPAHLFQIGFIELVLFFFFFFILNTKYVFCFRTEQKDLKKKRKRKLAK